MAAVALIPIAVMAIVNHKSMMLVMVVPITGLITVAELMVIGMELSGETANDESHDRE